MNIDASANIKVGIELNAETVFNEYSTFIRQCIASFFKSIGRRFTQDEVEDIFQETALKILKNGYLERFDASRSSLRTWLGMIARTTAIDILRRDRHDCLGLDRDIPVTCDYEAAVEPLPLPGGLLTERQRQVLELGLCHGLDAGDIARRLGVARATVRSIKRQAVERLREHFIHQRTGRGPEQTPRRVLP